MRLPEACAGRAVRCPVCGSTYKAPAPTSTGRRSCDAITTGSQGGAPQVPPRDGQQAAGAGTDRYRTPWHPGRTGLVLIMVGQLLELIVLALTLAGVYQGMMENDPDFQTYEWSSPLSRLGVLEKATLHRDEIPKSRK